MNKGAEQLSVAERLSAVADGEGDRDDVAAMSLRWRDDSELRARWHSYQLIGDAMRSDELSGEGRDAAFLARLRERLSHEPVVLAPSPTETAQQDQALTQQVSMPSRDAARAARVGRRWSTPAAMAAGFVMVAGAVMVMRSPSEAPAPQIAQQPQPLVVAAKVPAPVTPDSSLIAASTRSAAAAPEVAIPFQGVLLRDARMQQYFAAHQQFGGSTALGLPSAFLRNATFETPAVQAESR